MRVGQNSFVLTTASLRGTRNSAGVKERPPRVPLLPTGVCCPSELFGSDLFDFDVGSPNAVSNRFRAFRYVFAYDHFLNHTCLLRDDGLFGGLRQFDRAFLEGLEIGFGGRA